MCALSSRLSESCRPAPRLRRHVRLLRQTASLHPTPLFTALTADCWEYMRSPAPPCLEPYRKPPSILQVSEPLAFISIVSREPRVRCGLECDSAVASIIILHVQGAPCFVACSALVPSMHLQYRSSGVNQFADMLPRSGWDRCRMGPDL